MKPFGRKKIFVTCKPPGLSGYAFEPHYPRPNNFQNKFIRQGFSNLGNGGKSPSLAKISPVDSPQQKLIAPTQ